MVWAWLAAGLACSGLTAFASSAQALDEVVLINGRHYLGTIVSSTPDRVVLAIDGGTVEFPRALVASPLHESSAPAEVAPAPPDPSAMAAVAAPEDYPLPDLPRALRSLRSFPWARNVRQVPVLVIIQGRWQFIPCTSFWAGDFFQVSIFGDPLRPVAIESSLHRPAPAAWDEKRHVLEYMLSLVPGLAIDNRFDQLDVNGDSFAVGDLWFEVTAPDSLKTPGRWAVLLLHEPALTAARAGWDELEAISEPVAAATLDPTRPRSWQRGSWTPEELAWMHQVPGAPRVEPAPATGSPETAPAVAWTSIGGERIFARSFAREEGRFVRTSREWLRDAGPPAER